MIAVPFRDQSRLLQVLLALAIALAGAAGAYIVAAGSPLRDAAIALALLSPLALYFALVRPLVFPYTLYIALVPFDTLLGVSSAGTLTKMLGIATGVLLLFYCMRTARVAAPSQPLKILLLFLAWMAASLLWAIVPEHSLPWLQTYVGLALLYAALSLTPIAFSEFRIILFAIVTGFLVAAVVGIVSFHNMPDALANNARSLANHRLVLRIGNVYIDPNDYADAFVFPIAIATIFALRSNWLVVKIAGFTAVACMTMAMVMSGSRESLVSLGVLMLYFLWRSRYRLQLLASWMVIVIAVAPSSSTLWTRFQTALATGGQGRTSIWAVGIAAVKHYGLFGSGIGTFPDAYNQFFLRIPQIYSYGWNAPPHNLVLHFWVELGIIGLALVVWFIVANFTMLQKIGRNHPLYDYRLMIEGGLISVCVASFFIDTLNAKWVWLVFGTVAQLVYLASVRSRETERAA